MSFKQTFIVLLVALQIFSYSCAENKDASPDNFRLIAWKHLQKEEMTEEVTTSVQDAKLGESTWGNVETVTVLFHTTTDALRGPIVVHINTETKEVVGVQPRL